MLLSLGTCEELCASLWPCPVGFSVFPRKKIGASCLLLQEARPQMNLKQSIPPWNAVSLNTHHVWGGCWGNEYVLKFKTILTLSKEWQLVSKLNTIHLWLPCVLFSNNEEFVKECHKRCHMHYCFLFLQSKIQENRSSFSHHHKMIFLYFMVTTDTSFKLTFNQ